MRYTLTTYLVVDVDDDAVEEVRAAAVREVSGGEVDSHNVALPGIASSVQAALVALVGGPTFVGRVADELGKTPGLSLVGLHLDNAPFLD